MAEQNKHLQLWEEVVLVTGLAEGIGAAACPF
jgi:hypothetical protein